MFYLKLYLYCLILLLAPVTTMASTSQNTTLLTRMEKLHLGYHRGNTDVAQENSKAAVAAVLESEHPYIEVDITSFKDNGKEVGLLVHENTMERTTGQKGVFQDITYFNQLPKNHVNPKLPAEVFISVITLFDIIKQYQNKGKDPVISLDIKVEEEGFEFGQWLGSLIKEYGFEDRILASSFTAYSLTGIKKTCPNCLTGGVIFKDHWALQFLNTKYSSLDITPISKLGFFLGFPGKQEFPHDFVLIHDEIFFDEPELANYWRDKRSAKFVGIFTQEEDGQYSNKQWQLIHDYEIKWTELAPEQIKHYKK